MRCHSLLGLVAPLAFTCCDGSSDGGKPSQRVVVYTALDRAFSEPIFREFTRETGIKVAPLYDTESTKTVGLANRIRAERGRPRADVFWNNEIVNTLKLKNEGLLDVCRPDEATHYPAQYQDPDGYWYGFAARARVLIVNTKLVTEENLPRSVRELAAGKWKGRTAIAKPLFGTTASHVACLFVVLGDNEATSLLRALKSNRVQIHGGNKGCAVAVAEGRAAFGLTDTDDAMVELEAGKPVRIVYPDDFPEGTGTLFLPNTLARVKGGPHPEEAQKLINFLLTARVEELLAAGPSAQIPLHRSAKSSPRVRGPRDVKPMAVDFARAAAAFDRARQVVESELLK